MRYGLRFFLLWYPMCHSFTMRTSDQWFSGLISKETHRDTGVEREMSDSENSPRGLEIQPLSFPMFIRAMALQLFHHEL